MLKLAFLFIFPLIVYSQNEADCIQSRWISLKNKETNKRIFEYDSTNIQNVIEYIKWSIDDEYFVIYAFSEELSWQKEFQPIAYKNELLKIEADSTRNLEYEKDPYFELLEFATGPYHTIYNGDSITVNDEGSIVNVYPPPLVYTFKLQDCAEIRIKEDRVFNDSKNEYEFLPVAMGFYFDQQQHRPAHEKFWIELHDLIYILKDYKTNIWYQAVLNKDYKGFQYMQVPCN